MAAAEAGKKPNEGAAAADAAEFVVANFSAMKIISEHRTRFGPQWIFLCSDIKLSSE